MSDYVPFYFAPRSPMLFAIHRGNVEGYDGGQEGVLHLVSNAEAVDRAADLQFCFTEGHAEMGFSEFFEDLHDLSKVDWRVMKALYWRDTEEDLDRKRRRQAEFLVHRFFPWPLVTQIAVMNDKVAHEVEKIIAECEHKPTIVIERQWYY